MESTNYIVGTTFNLFNILNQTFYDFRIYCINHNKNRPTKYLYINNRKTGDISSPSLLQILLLLKILIILYHHLIYQNLLLKYSSFSNNKFC